MFSNAVVFLGVVVVVVFVNALGSFSIVDGNGNDNVTNSARYTSCTYFRTMPCCLLQNNDVKSPHFQL